MYTYINIFIYLLQTSSAMRSRNFSSKGIPGDGCTALLLSPGGRLTMHKIPYSCVSLRVFNVQGC